MKFENPEYYQEKMSYPDELESRLEVKEIIDELENEFDIFLQQNNKEIKSEHDALRLIKIFIYRDYGLQERIKSITAESILSGVDCLTLSIITCLLAKRKGYDVKIGHPDRITRYLHSLIIRQNGEMFKIAGKSRNYKVVEMKTEEVIDRLKKIKPVMDAIDSVVAPAKKYLKNL